MYIFEDKSTDLLSILFKKAYPDKISSGFNFMGGVGNILLKVQNLMQESSFDETIYIFMDLIPDKQTIERLKIYAYYQDGWRNKLKLLTDREIRKKSGESMPFLLAKILLNLF